MLMRDEPTELILGHVVNEKFERVPEFKVTQRKDIDGWYGSMFEADFLTLVRHQTKNMVDLFFDGKPPRGLRPVIKAGNEEIEYYLLKATDQLPTGQHTLLEMTGKDGKTLRIALKRPPGEIKPLTNFKWHSEAIGDFRIAALVSVIKAAFLTLFWKAGYGYALSLAGRSIGYDLLGKFYLDNMEKSREDVLAAAMDFFKPYVNMVRPADYVEGTAPRGTIEDNRALIWLGSSGQVLGIGVFVRTDDRLQMVMMPSYSDAEGVATYLDWLNNKRDALWVREGAFNMGTRRWDVCPERVPVIWPKTHATFDLSRPARELVPRPQAAGSPEKIITAE
jgi:hypothetical protein